MIKQEEFWMWQAVFGKGVNRNVSPETTCTSFDNYFCATYRDKLLFLIIMSAKSRSWQFPDAVPITNLFAYRVFGISLMEEASEKTYVLIK